MRWDNETGEAGALVGRASGVQGTPLETNSLQGPHGRGFPAVRAAAGGQV